MLDNINEKSVKIIFKEPQFESKLINTLTQENNLKLMGNAYKDHQI